MKSHNNNLNAAADLIRNLDVALSNMTAAANTASNDAAKARRNAKAAGEVARRYGSGSKGGGSGRKNNKQRAVAADNNNNLLLEKKREKRNAARIAAEVRQRREHPYNNYSSSSPSRMLGSPTTRRLGTPSRIFVERDDKVGGGGCEEGEEGLLLDKTVAAIQSRANQLEEANNKKKRQVVHGYDNSANISNDANYYHAETEKVNTARITENIPLPVVEPALEATTSLGSTYTEFEDAMEEEHNHYHYEGNENNMESVEGGSSIGQQPMMMGGDEVQIMADAEEDELKVQPVLQPPPTNNEYYNQQTSYYQSEDQAADSIDMGPQNFYKQDQEVQQNNNMVYNDFHQDENEQYYNEQQQTETEHREKQHQHASTPQKAKMSVVSTLSTPKHSIPPTPPRSQPTSTNRIEASHAEDVLTLSLELERLRSELATTTEQLTNATRENETLNVELTNIQSQCNLNNESTNAQLATLQQQLQNEQRKSKAAEEDAALALELAKDAQTTKEECEVWLSRSLEEIDLWKKKCLDMEQKLSSSKIMMEEGEEGGEEEKHVRFKDDCPPSPVVSEDGTFGLDDEDADIDNNASSPPMIKSTPPQPPPPPPPTPSTPAVDGAWSTPEDSKHMGMMMFSPTSLLSSETTPSKEAAVATGRAFLHRMTTPSSLSSSSPYASRGGLSPHPRLQASELLKKSAETRRLLRERLTPGRNGKLPRPPTTARINDDAKSSNPNNNTDDNAFASRQGAACKAVGKTIRESGARLKLNGKWWGGDNGATKLLTFGGSSTNSGEEGTIEELESMVKDYTASVEGTIGQQRTRIDELLAFCDHLEKEVMIM